MPCKPWGNRTKSWNPLLFGNECVHACVMMNYGYMHIQEMCFLCLLEYMLCSIGPPSHNELNSNTLPAFVD
jgi:hypothetical protein